ETAGRAGAADGAGAARHRNPTQGRHRHAAAEHRPDSGGHWRRAAAAARADQSVDQPRRVAGPLDMVSRNTVVIAAVATLWATVAGAQAPKSAELEQIKQRQRISLMEGVLERAVANGAD